MPQPLTLTAPGKTFLLGEYIALDGGPTLVVTTNPRFTLTIDTDAPGISNIHPDSPAGRLLQAHPQYAQNHHCQFFDPHHGRGGLGASSAQFLLVYQAIHGLTPAAVIDWQPARIAELLACYHQHAWSGQGVKPSGADVVAQAVGQICQYTREPFSLRSDPWPFADIAFVIAHTGNKLATHQHLANVPSYPGDELKAIAQAAIASFHQAQATAFIQAVQAYADCLAAHHLVAEHTRQLSAKLQQLPGVLACKGCGALGADTLLIFAQPTAIANLTGWLHQHRLPPVAHTHDIATGLTLATNG
jgi:mevalonate kinase